MYANLMQLDRLGSIGGNNDCYMADQGNHWIVAVGLTLTHRIPWMCMDVSNYLEGFRFAKVP